MTREADDLDGFITDRTKKDPDFPKRVEAAAARRRGTATEIVPVEKAKGRAERIEHEPEPVAPGSWVWVKPGEGQPAEWLGCVTHVGSNYAKVESPQGVERRIHLEKFDQETRPEPDAKGVLARIVGEGKKKVAGLLAEVKDVTARLGVAPTPGPAQAENYAIATRLAGASDMKEYGTALERAKKEELPRLFEQIKRENERLAEWMSAEILPLKATFERASEAMGLVEDRIFNVSLYAGLTEQVVQFADGEPAPADAKLHVLQTRLYMDEESLLGYEHGGLEFRDIGKFDAWLAKPSNRDRILPFPRTLVAMRVRRHQKERDSHGSLATAWINVNLAELDKLTFFYFRNGNRVFRMNCDLEFGELIFPPKDEFLAEPSMVKVERGKVGDIITVRDYEQRLEDEAAERGRAEEWFAANPFKEWSAKELEDDRAKFQAKLKEIEAEHAEAVREANESASKRRSGQERFFVKWRKDPEHPGTSTGVYSDEVDAEERERHVVQNLEKDLREALEQKKKAVSRAKDQHRDRRRWSKSRRSWEDANPHFTRHRTEKDGWEPFDKSSVYYDECLKNVHEQAKHWNRIALIIQGLFDRSEVFHPHPPVSSWTPQGFAAAIELVYDGSHVLTPGPAPDFEEYRLAGLAKLGPGCVTIGQRLVWLERERQREEERRDRSGSHGISSSWKPDWDDGPGYVARIARWDPKKRTATYKWLRGKRGSWRGGHDIRDSITVGEDDLFNVSAYVPGDYRRFFDDPRTRKDYLKWAPILLTAEEHHAGNAPAQEPETKKPEGARVDEDVRLSGKGGDE